MPYVPDEAALAKREARKVKKEFRDANPRPPKESAQEDSPAPEDADAPIEKMDVDSASLAPVAVAAPAASKETPSSSAMTALQKSMQKKLGGARFRWINEQLVRRASRCSELCGLPSVATISC